MYQNNSFITLTYNDENLKSDRLQYIDFQLFQKRLRDKIYRDFIKSFGLENWKLLDKEEKKLHYKKIAISILVTGEYGDKEKRPHWHALIFNWRPSDEIYSHSNHRGDRIYKSKELDELWGKGFTELGQITLESAGYVARYATKKLYHGKDGTHNYEPISKRSSKNAIGKTWLESFYHDAFDNGCIVLPDGSTAAIPRYYEKWLKKHHPKEWERYVTTTKHKRIKEAEQRYEKTSQEERKANLKRSGLKGLQRKRSEAQEIILNQKMKNNQKHLKL